MTALLGLDVGRPDHFAPLFGFLLKPPPVIRGRAAGDAAAQVGKPLLFRLSMIHLSMQPHRNPAQTHSTVDLRAGRSGDRQRAQPAAPDAPGGEIEETAIAAGQRRRGRRTRPGGSFPLTANARHRHAIGYCEPAPQCDANLALCPYVVEGCHATLRSTDLGDRLCRSVP